MATPYSIFGLLTGQLAQLQLATHPHAEAMLALLIVMPSNLQLTLGRAVGGAFQAAGDWWFMGLVAAEAAAGRLSASAWDIANTCSIAQGGSACQWQMFSFCST